MKDNHLTFAVLSVAALCLLGGGYFYWRDNHAYNHPMYVDRLQRTVDNWPSPHWRGHFQMVREPHCVGPHCKVVIRGVHDSDSRGTLRTWDCTTDPCKEGEVLYDLGRFLCDTMDAPPGCSPCG